MDRRQPQQHGPPVQLVLVLLLATCAWHADASNNGVARKPALGWNTWCSTFLCGLDVCSEQQVTSTALAMIDNGLQAAGYNYINLDDCWAATTRDANGDIQPDPDRFPSGIRNLTTWLHARGFLFGLYTSAGSVTCNPGMRPAPIPGSFGHYEADARTFARWGVDFVKIDWCGDNCTNALQQHTQFSNALNATGRPIWLELCRGYGYPPPPYVAQVANSWRVTGDHQDEWTNTQHAIEEVAGQTAMSAPGNWAYNDFLMTGGQGCPTEDPDHTGPHCPGMADDEYRTEFAIWVVTASPLIVATDVRNLTKVMVDLLLNMEAIAINQDHLVPAGDRVAKADCDGEAGACQVWRRVLSDGGVAVVLYNAGEQAHTIGFAFPAVGWRQPAAVVRNVWTRQDLGRFNGSYSVLVPPHASAFVRLSETPYVPPPLAPSPAA